MKLRTRILSFVIVICMVLPVLSLVTAGKTVRADSEGGVEGFVTRLYEICLEREPDQGGLNSWVNRLTTGRITGAQAARGFVFSNEFTRRNLDNRSFVNSLYRVMFDRDPDAQGLDAWTAALNGGMTRSEAFDGFTDSVEWANTCAAYGIQSGSSSAPSVDTGTSPSPTPVPSPTDQTSADGIEGFVRRLYSGFLGRSPDPAGLSDWTSRLSSGQTTGFDAANGFIESDEFHSRARTMSATTLVTVFYNTFLGRNPTASDVTYYTSRMGSDLEANLQMLLLCFSNSDEFISYCESNGIIPGAGNGASLISDAEVTQIFNRSVLIGSSTTEGFKLYFSAYGRGIMGNVNVCSRVSYSLLNDMTNRTAYLPVYNGTPLRARDIIQSSGCDYAFICMGTNDISNGVVTRYCNYLDDIRSLNPDTVIFVEACTPSLDDHPANVNIRELNDAMESYCDTHEGFIFIDTYTPLADSNGVLQRRYCSDGNVHITYSGYAKWIETLTDAVRQYIYEQRIAGNPV